MSMSWVERITSAGVAGTAHANTVTAASLIPTVCQVTLANNYFDQIGKAIKIKARGKISTAASGMGTYTFEVRFGSIVVFTFTTGTLVASASNLTWDFEVELICRSVGNGTSATLLGIGKLESYGLSATVPLAFMPASSPAVGNGFDGTSGQLVDFFGDWSAAVSGNTITCEHYALELLS